MDRYFRVIKSAFQISYRSISFSRVLSCTVFVRFLPNEPELVSIDFDYPPKNEGNFRHRVSLKRPRQEMIDAFIKRVKIKVNVDIEKKIKKKKFKDVSLESVTNKILNSIIFKIDGKEVEDKELNLLRLFNRKDVSVKLNEFNYNIFLNPPWINNVRLPKTIVAGTPSLPDISIAFGTYKQLEVTWLVSKDGHHWDLVALGILFYPSSVHSGMQVKVKCVCPVTNQEMISKTTTRVIQGPEQISIQRRAANTENFLSEPDSFRVMTYNLLADSLSDSYIARSVLFKHCPEHYLSMEYRQSLLVNEIKNYHCDIICLQEVDKQLFHNFYSVFLQLCGYESIYVVKNATSQEGQAIFWRTNKFKLLKSANIQFLGEHVLQETGNLFADIRECLNNCDLMRQTWVNISQSVACCVLQSCSNPLQQLVVGSSHLFFKPDGGMIRLLQLVAILRHLQDVQEKATFSSGDHQDRPPIVFAGDLNDSRMSPALQFLLKGRNYDSTMKNVCDSYEHNLELASAYPASEVPFTTLVPQFCGELDYIVYQSNAGLTCRRHIPLPRRADILAHAAGMPNADFPSDHLALVADLQFLH